VSSRRTTQVSQVLVRVCLWAVPGVAFVLLAACKPGGPVELPASAVECARCHMVIADARFAVQVHTDKGRVLFFDSVECARDYVAEHRDRVARVFFRSFLDPPRWLEGERTWIARWAGVRSPMGGNLAAFSSEQEARAWLDSKGAKAGDFDLRPWSEFVARPAG